MKLIILLFLSFITATAHAELSTKECRVAVGAEAIKIIGANGESAVRICSESKNLTQELHRLSDVWRSSVGFCYFFEEVDEYVKGRTYLPMPRDIGVFGRLPSRFMLYVSFEPNCGPQDAAGYFSVLLPIEERKIAAIRTMWQRLNLSDASFSKFKYDFHDATGGASSKWSRGKLQIRFLDLIEGDTSGWQRLLRIKKDEYILGLKDGCCEMFMATLDIGSQGAIIKNVVSSVH